MILMPDLFSFAYVPNWYSQLDMLAEMALPEPWRFKNPIYLTKNPDTPILERYIHAIFKKQLIDYTSEQALYRLLRLFSKVRARLCRCSSFPNRTRCAGLRSRFGCGPERVSIYTVWAPLCGAGVCCRLK